MSLEKPNENTEIISKKSINFTPTHHAGKSDLPKLSHNKNIYSIRSVKSSAYSPQILAVKKPKNFNNKSKICFSKNLELVGIYDKNNYDFDNLCKFYSNCESSKRKIFPIMLKSIKISNDNKDNICQNNNDKNDLTKNNSISCQQYYPPIMMNNYRKNNLDPFYYITAPQEKKFVKPQRKVISLKKIITNKMLEIYENDKKEEEKFIEEDKNFFSEDKKTKEKKSKKSSLYKIKGNYIITNVNSSKEKQYKDLLQEGVSNKRLKYREQMIKRFLSQHGNYFGEKVRLRGINQTEKNENEEEDNKGDRNKIDATNIFLTKLPGAKITGYEKTFIKNSNNKSVECNINKNIKSMKEINLKFKG